MHSCDLRPPPCSLDAHHLKHTPCPRLGKVSKNTSCGLSASNLTQRRRKKCFIRAHYIFDRRIRIDEKLLYFGSSNGCFQGTGNDAPVSSSVLFVAVCCVPAVARDRLAYSPQYSLCSLLHPANSACNACWRRKPRFLSRLWPYSPRKSTWLGGL